MRRLLHNIVFLASGLQHNADFGKLVRPLLKLGPTLVGVVNGMHSIDGLAGLGHIDIVHILGNRHTKGGSTVNLNPPVVDELKPSL